MHLLGRQLEEQVEQRGQQNDVIGKDIRRPGVPLLAALNEQSAAKTTTTTPERKPASARRWHAFTPFGQTPKTTTQRATVG
jgi:hypothetical protein